MISNSTTIGLYLNKIYKIFDILWKRKLYANKIYFNEQMLNELLIHIKKINKY